MEAPRVTPQPPELLDEEDEGVVRLKLSLDRELPLVLALERRRNTIAFPFIVAAYFGLIWLDRKLYAAQIHGLPEFLIGMIVGFTALGLIAGEALRRHLRNERVRRNQWMNCERCLADLRHSDGHGRCPNCNLECEMRDLRRRWRKALDQPGPNDQCSLRVEPDLVSHEVLEVLQRTCPEIPGAGLREPFAEWPEGVAAVEPARAVASARLGVPARLTRAIVFDKAPGRNWTLEVHQDTTVALADRGTAANNVGPWSLKHGVWHAEASAELLRRMVTVRLHLDTADESSGCLLFYPHEMGEVRKKLDPEALGRLREYLRPARVEAGDAVVMSPLTPHASGRNTTDRHRRVLHMEFAGEEPSCGLRWRDEAEILGQPPTRP
ncbi:MAG: phytanoyl-CoA dioxygenase family protein [Planctomycetota bacterium]